MILKWYLLFIYMNIDQKEKLKLFKRFIIGMSNEEKIRKNKQKEAIWQHEMATMLTFSMKFHWNFHSVSFREFKIIIFGVA